VDGINGLARPRFAASSKGRWPMTGHWLPWIVVILLQLPLIPYFLFLLTISLAALLPRRGRHSLLTKGRVQEDPRFSGARSADRMSKFMVAIPAHDEEPVIGTVVKSCLDLDYPDSCFQVVVIADNCSDRTASLAERAGARVIERFDDLNKSKGHAIDYLLGALRKSGEIDSIDALVIVDADSTVDRDLLRAFDLELKSGHDWIQAYYTVSNPDESWRTRLLTYSFSLFNGVMPLGKSRLGISGAFTGNGMCFSVKGLKRVPWRSHGLVEDMEYSWAVRIAGENIVFLPEVAVYGAMLASGGAAAEGQRRRWEFGRREMSKKFFGPLLRSRRHGFWEKVFLLCELTLPSLGVLSVVYAALALADLVFLLAGREPAAAIFRPVLMSCLTLMTLALALYAVTPFLRLGLPWRYGLNVISFPVYLIWKFRVALRGRPRDWVRTPRETPSSGSTQLADKSS
jgi:cellulose synthase/poly-beta-1,6-N-acetylglucosamine synthase-like glycosyltransferase